MKKIALTIAALSLSAGAAFAENPYVGDTSVVQSGPNAGQAIVDRSATASIGGKASAASANAGHGVVNYIDPAANRYGDGAPRN